MQTRHGARSQRTLRLVFLAILLLTIALALYPELRLPEPALMRGMMDLVYHSLGFAMLAVIGGRAWPSVTGVTIGLVAGSIFLELAQYLSPGRGTHWEDILANFFGIVCGMILLFTANRLQALKMGD